MKSIIFYGAGEHARLHIGSWEGGIIPNCFADADPKKHYTKFVGGQNEYDILPFHEAINRCPDYELYLTVHPDSFHEIAAYLETNFNIPKEHIKRPSFEYRLGCGFLNGDCIVNSCHLFACCNRQRQPVRIARSGSIANDVNALIELVSSVNAGLREGGGYAMRWVPPFKRGVVAQRSNSKKCGICA